MKVLMLPALEAMRSEESGIKRVIEAYHRHLPRFGIELVPQTERHYDLKVAHAGVTGGDCDVAMIHGLYWTGDYPAAGWEWKVNAQVIEALRAAKQVTVPSEWVAETIRRDMRFSPRVIGHGIEWDAWQDAEESNTPYILWNKNRAGDVCDPAPVRILARRFPDLAFVTTFYPDDTPPDNVTVIGKVDHATMQMLIKHCAVYLATTKETFGIGILEAMAAGKIVLGSRHGGIIDLVEHGITGYLAALTYEEDLAQGLAWCLQHRRAAGAQGREAARGYTWARVARQVAEVYQAALFEESPRISVIIPCFNYQGVVGRAVKSALEQSFPPTEIIVVDDGSDNPDAIDAAVAEVALGSGRVTVLHKPNGGVATARNAGALQATSKYLCFLDADDAIAPRFLEACVKALERDRTLGAAYTGLQWIKSDGSEGLSEWPGEWEYDRQLAGHNQIPTCCVVRADAWHRLGGQRQRYAPRGAGEEDAEFWLRLGAYGWRAAQATGEGLFRYSWLSGRVSGNRDHQMVDYRAWHPWTKDSHHPFASLARPRRYSHPVRQYDEPAVSVVIPVGPGHEDLLVNALDSLEAQTERRWEVIVVDDVPTGHNWGWLKRAYPYIRWVYSGGAGAARARNLGATIARAGLLLFLDADDTLVPDALEQMLARWYQTGEAVYSDYYGKAHVTDLEALDPALKARVRFHDERETIIEYRAADYDCQRALRQPETPPYIWCNITTLIPKAWHTEIGGFDEAMSTWEDIDYWWRLARAGKCFTRIEAPLLVYRFTTGARRDHGLRIWPDLIQYLQAKYQEQKPVGCQTCGGNRVAKQQATNAHNATASAQTAMADRDMILVRYLHGNRGLHPVRGPATRIKYGYRKHGDTFLVHRADLEAWPHLFERVEVNRTPVQRTTVPIQASPPPPPPPDLAARRTQPDTEPALAGIHATQIRAADPRVTSIAPVISQDFDLQMVPGITKEIAAQLREAQVITPPAILELGTQGLRAFKGVGEKRAEMIIVYLEEKYS